MMDHDVDDIVVLDSTEVIYALCRIKQIILS